MNNNWIDIHNNLEFLNKKFNSKNTLSYLLYKVGHLKSKSGSYTIQKWKENIDLIKSYFSRKKNLKILEIGCGTGAMLYCMQKHGKIFGVDPSEEMLKIAKNKIPNGKFFLKKGHQIDFFKKNFFDVVLIYSTVQYFPNLEYLKKIIKKIGKVLKRDGLVYIGDIPDIEKKNIIIKEKKKLLGYSNYKKNYLQKNLKHLYVKRSSIIKIMENGFYNLEIYNSKKRGTEKLGNRFDVFGYKK